MKYIALVTGWNCKEFVKPCYDSLKEQDCDSVFISDGSTDGTDKEVLKLDGCYKTIGQHNQGAAYRRFKAIQEISKNPEDVILLIGMDDIVLPGAIDRIKQEYEAGAWMTYGNWKSDAMKFPKESLYYSDETHANRSYRKEKYRSTHLCTFKRFLFDKLSENDFKVNGEWIKATTESPMMFASLEMCGKERIGVIEDYIYFYTERNKQRAKFRFGKQYQNDIYNEIINRDKFDLL